MSCYIAVFTSENRDDISTSTSTGTRQSTVSSAILLNIGGSWYREFRQEMVFCAYVCPYAYVAGILTCINCLCLCLCLCLCPSENQPLRTTRSSQMLNIPLFKTASGQRTFYYRTVSIWNSMDSYFRTLKSVSAFKYNMKRKLVKDFIDS